VGKPALCQESVFSVNPGASLFFIAVPTLSTKPGELDHNRRQQAKAPIGRFQSISALGNWL
jgi:hypothetical protein